MVLPLSSVRRLSFLTCRRNSPPARRRGDPPNFVTFYQCQGAIPCGPCIDASGTPHDIISRGLAGPVIFRDDADRADMFARLAPGHLCSRTPRPTVAAPTGPHLDQVAVIGDAPGYGLLRIMASAMLRLVGRLKTKDDGARWAEPGAGPRDC